jgi:RNA polymerase sigma-70 factor (ECF subfamily)
VKATERAGHAAPGAIAVEPRRMGAGELYRAHVSFVAGFLTRMGAMAGDLDDLTQEVFLVAHRRGGYVEGPARPTTWLADIAVRVLSTHRRTQRRKHAAPSTDAVEASTSDAAAPDEQLATRRALERVQACLDGLDDDHRAVFVLFELEGEPCASIATALGIPTGTVYSRLHHARRRFLEAWGEGAAP